MRAVLTSLCFIAVVGGVAWAQQAPPAPGVLDQVYACAGVSDETQRLACYDNAVGRLRQAQQSGDLVAVDRHQAEEIEREAFGFTLPSIPRLFGGARPQAEQPEEAVAEVQMVIERVTMRADGKPVFHMTNGQVWAQIDTERNRRAQAGAQVTVRRAALGSYQLVPDGGGRAVRVHRSE